MAPRRPNPPSPQSPSLGPDQIRRRIEGLENCIRALETFDPQQVQKRHGIPEVMALEASIKAGLAAAFGDGTPAYNRYRRAASLDNGPHQMRMGNAFGRGPVIDYDARDAHEARQYLTEGKAQSIALLRTAIRTLQSDLADHEVDSSPPPSNQPLTPSNKVFIVHGHDEAALQAVARFLEQLQLDAIILREQPDAGRTIIEKFEECAADVGFAVVLLTPDDLGGVTTGAATTSRARQNVIFELGYFAGKLGRGRACLMRKGVVEIPSDLHGVIYTDLDPGDGWKIKLAKEMKAAKLDFDANRAWG